MHVDDNNDYDDNNNDDDDDDNNNYLTWRLVQVSKQIRFLGIDCMLMTLIIMMMIITMMMMMMMMIVMMILITCAMKGAIQDSYNLLTAPRTFSKTYTQVTREKIIIMIALKSAIRDFSLSPHCAASCLQHVRSSGQGGIVCKSRATHRALITCTMSCATWYERTAQLLSFTEFKSHLS